MRAFEIAVVGLFVLAVLFAVHAAADLVLPVLLAVFVNFLLSPVIRRMRGFRIPGGLAAALLLTGLTAGAGAGLYALRGPTVRWLTRAPAALRRAGTLFRRAGRPVVQMQTVTRSLEEAAGLSDPGQARVQIAEAPLVAKLFGGTTAFLEIVVTTLVLSFLLLAPGDVFTDRLVALLRRRRHREEAVRISHAIEHQISRYLGTVAVINAGVGLVTWAAMAWLGLPDPGLWGALAALANFIPYVGPLGCVVVIALASLSAFGPVGAALAPPLVYGTVHVLESYLVTPLLLERWLAVNAVVTFVTVLLLWMLLGLAGAVLTVPLLVALKIVATSVDSWRPLSALLGGGPRPVA